MACRENIIMSFHSYGTKPKFVRFHRQSFNRPRPKGKSFNPTHFVTKTQNVSQPNITVPITHTFADFALHPTIMENIEGHGYTVLTPIQDRVIPEILEGKDVVGLANTGTGKTAAFLIPLIHQSLARPSQKVLIIAPTRELAVQINAEFRSLSRNTVLRSAICIGGVGQYQQRAELRHNPQFVMGTPGRLMDFKRQNVLNLLSFNTVVLDEVDQMLDMGFIRDITSLVQSLGKPRQSLFFSATLPDSVRPVMDKFLTNPVIISVAKAPIVAAVKQSVIELKGRQRIDVLHELLTTQGFNKVLVFFRTKHGTNNVAKRLGERGLNVVAIHGNKSQGQRQTALNLFKSERVKVLLATDIASRGLDINDVSHVINYDMPGSEEDYIHRIGRTARADKGGEALTLVD